MENNLQSFFDERHTQEFRMVYRKIRYIYLSVLAHFIKAIAFYLHFAMY